MGYFKAVTRQPFQVEPFGGPEQPFKIGECSIKRFPLGQYSQTVVQAALEVRDELPDIDDIVQVKVSTLQTAVNIMAGDPEKWRPVNRETADHSMPYTVAVALMYGGVDQSHFDDEYLRTGDCWTWSPGSRSAYRRKPTVWRRKPCCARWKW